MTSSVAVRLWLGFAVVIALNVAAAFLSYQYLSRISEELQRLVGTVEPLEEAVLEMEINAKETAEAVVSYANDVDPAHLAVIHDSEVDFDQFAAEYQSIAESADERALGLQVAQLYGRFKLLGNEVVRLADERKASRVAFQQNISDIDDLIDDQIQASIDRSGSQAAIKVEAALELEVNIFESLTAILGYISNPDLQALEVIEDANEDFHFHLNNYRRAGLSSQEEIWLNSIETDFEKSVAAGSAILGTVDQLAAQLLEFERVLDEMDALFDDQIQPLIDAETAAASASTADVTQEAVILLLAFSGFAVIGGGLMAWAISGSILGPLRTLMRGAAVVGDGDLTHRMVVDSKSEFVQLASSFNTMLDNLVTAQQDLQDGQRRLRSIQDTAADAIITIDSCGRITSYNRTAEQLFGYAADEVTGLNVKILMPAPFHDEHDGYLTRYLETGEKRIIGTGREVIGRHRDGSTFPMDLAVSEFRQGNEIGFTGIVRDITDRKYAEEMKDEFISTVSHELRTPLTSIRGSLGLLRGGVSGELSEQANALVELADRNCDRLVRLINDLLDIEKIEAGKLSFDLQRCDLVDLVRQSAKANQPFADKFKVSIAVTEAPDRAVALVDADRFAQVMANLISNAAKFSRVNSQVDLSVGRRDGWIEVTVTDYGAGIPEEFRDRLFEKFTQSDVSDKRGTEGSGLGLSIVKAIVERHGGRVSFESELRQGTSFRVTLPDLTPDQSLSAGEGSDVSKSRILVCEDDPDVAMILTKMLARSGYQCDIAYDAEQAKTLLAQQDYAAMSLDLLLPGQDGISLIRELRGNARTRQLPIIVVSIKASESRSEINNGDALMVIDWLQKPIEPSDLLHAIRLGVEASVARPRILYANGNGIAAAKVSAQFEELLDITAASSLGEALAKLREQVFDLAILDFGASASSAKEQLASVREIASAQLPVMILAEDQSLRDLAAEIAETLTESSTSCAGLRGRIETLIRSGSGGAET